MKPAKLDQLNFAIKEGSAALQSASYEIATKYFETALKLSPKNPYALCGLGRSLDAQGHQDKARPYYLRATIFGPDIPDVQLSYASYLMQTNKLSEALVYFDITLKICESSKYTQRSEVIKKYALFNKAVTLRHLNRPNEAVPLYRAYLSQFGTDATVLFNLANALDANGESQSAIEVYHEALKLTPDAIDIKKNLAETFNSIGYLDQAEALFNELISAEKFSAPARFGLSLVKLKRKSYETGWDLYNARWADNDFISKQNVLHARFIQEYQKPITRDDVRGRSILVVDEQGVGDVIMFASILSELSKTASRVTALINARQLILFRNSFPNIDFLDFEYSNNLDIKDYDVVIPFGHLPSLFRRSIDDFNFSRYLQPTEEKIEYYKKVIRSYPQKIAIGISWQGGVATTRLRHRSLSLNQLKEILDIPDCAYVSLQYGNSAQEADEYNSRYGANIISFPSVETNDLNNLAALIEALDFVVTVQNTNVHLSGALNKKCFAILPFSPEWRYGIEGDRMPWYDSVKLFRQSQFGIWIDVVNRVKCDILDYLKTIERGS